jgi:hypothetical protein
MAKKRRLLNWTLAGRGYRSICCGCHSTGSDPKCFSAVVNTCRSDLGSDPAPPAPQEGENPQPAA